MNQVALLKWFLSAGISNCIGEKPINRFEKPSFSSTKPLVLPANANNEKQINETPFLTQAITAAQNATNLEELDKSLNSFEGCSLKKTAKYTFTGMGQINKPVVMCLIDTPKSADERSGQLASGDSGELLIKMLSAIQLSCQTNTYLCPLIPWRLPGDRIPTETEIQLCLPFLKRRIEFINPDFLLIFGSIPTRALLEIDSIAKARQQKLVYKKGNSEISAVATFGPDMVMKGQSYRKSAWEDLQKLAQKIKNNEEKTC